MNASDRPNTCKSRGSEPVAIPVSATGEWVSNTCATFPQNGDSLPKGRLTPDGPASPHEGAGKLKDCGWARVPLGSWRGNGPPNLRWVGVLRGKSPTLELRHGPNSYGRQQ